MPHLEILLFGPPRVMLDDRPVDINRRKALALLAYLAVTRQAHTRDALAALFWPDSDQSRAYAYLRTTLWTLNKALGDDWLDTEHDLVALRSDHDLRVDVARFRTLLQRAPADEPEACITQLSEAAALYQDDFLAGFTLPDSPAFDEWQFFEQESLRQQLGSALDTLIRCHVALRQIDSAIPYAQRRLALDALHEPAHRELMRLYAWAGQWSAALRQYQQCASILTDELGADPDPESQALHALIQARVVPPLPGEPQPARKTTTQTLPTPGSAEVPPGNIPAQTTPFIAREREQVEIMQIMDDPGCRLLTLVGQGGIGKTRLALHVATDLAGRYPGGAYFVPLAPVNAAEYLVPAIADALQFPASREGDPKNQLMCYLQEKHLLLVIDNFEHLLDGADLVTEILTAAPNVKILATSRERLQLQEEWVYEIPGLAYPRDGDHAPPQFDEAARYGAVQLFVQSGRRVRPDFALDETNTGAVLRICRLVEGMPLGLELAAAWLQMLSPHEIAHEIERSLDFLSVGLRSLPPRHRSVRAVFETSWERLSSDEQWALSQLSVFRGGFGRDAAQAVAETSLRVLLALVSKSLLHRETDDHYSMHELLRQFAQEKLDSDLTVRDATHGRYAAYYAGMLRAWVPALKGGNQIDTLNTIEADIDNIRTAWILAVARRDVLAIRGLFAGLSLFYLMRSRLHESNEMFGGTAHYLETLDDLSDDERIVLAQIKINQARVLQVLGRQEEPEAIYSATLPVIGPLDSHEIALTLFILSALAVWPVGDLKEAERLARKALAIFEAHDDQWGIGRALHLLGDVAHHSIDYTTSQRLYQRSLAISRAIGDRWGEGTDLNMLGEVAYTLGDYVEAERLYRESVALAEAVGDRYNLAWCLDRVADVLSLQGRYDEAEVIAAQGVENGRELGNRHWIAYGFLCLTEITSGKGDFEAAMHYFRQSFEAFETTDSSEGPAWLRIAGCVIALAQGNTADLERFARESLVIFEQTRSPWGRSAALHYLGEAARCRGEFEAARRYLSQAVQLAVESKSIMLLMRYVVGFSALFAETGEQARAAELLTLAIQHPATWQITRERARRLLDSLAGDLTPETLATADQRAAARSIDAVIAELLAASPD